MKLVETEKAVGLTLCHDLARIVIGERKDTPFRRGHVVTAEDIPALLALGKEHLYVMEEADFAKVHEEDVAAALFDLCRNEHIGGLPVREGKIEAVAEIDGLFKVDVKRLDQINGIGDITIVTRYTDIAVKKGDKLAGMRCIPLLLPKEQLEAAKAIGGTSPLLALKPFVRWRAGVVTTGSEVYSGRIEDAFTPIIEERIKPFGMTMVAHETVTDNLDEIAEAIDKTVKAGADIVFCTGGMSVDPDDLTPGAIARYAKQVITYGLPVLPGSMFCIAYGEAGLPIIGLPGGVLFSQPTAFDRLLPRLAADDPITKEECVRMGHGGLMG